MREYECEHVCACSVTLSLFRHAIRNNAGLLLNLINHDRIITATAVMHLAYEAMKCRQWY